MFDEDEIFLNQDFILTSEFERMDFLSGDGKCIKEFECCRCLHGEYGLCTDWFQVIPCLLREIRVVSGE